MDHTSFEGGRCGICMDVVIDRGVLDCCQHWFCFACIDNWSTITNLCPLCQGEFQLITCVPVYDTIGSNNVDEDSLSRDNDWFVEGKSNALSFPSYYIDENVIILLLLSFWVSGARQLSAWMGMDAKLEVDQQLWREIQLLTHRLHVILVICGIMLFVLALILKALLKIHGYVQGRLEADDYFNGQCWAELGSGNPAIGSWGVGTLQLVLSKLDRILGYLFSLLTIFILLSCRCTVDEPQKSAVNLTQSTNSQCGPESAEGECLAEAAFSRKVSVSVADAGETAIVVSTVGGNQCTEEPNEYSQLMLEVDKGLRSETFINDGNGPKADSPLGKRTDIPTVLEMQELELSLLHGTSSSLPSNSLGHTELKISCSDEKVNEQCSSDGVKISLSKSFNEIYTGRKLFESESSIGLHLGLSVGSFLSVNDVNKDLTEDQITRDVQQQDPSGEPLPKADKIEPGAGEDASQIIGVKRNHSECRSLAIPCWKFWSLCSLAGLFLSQYLWQQNLDGPLLTDDDHETKAKDTQVSAKKIRAEEKTQIISVKEEADTSISNDFPKPPTLIAGTKDHKSKLSPQKANMTSIMSIVKGKKHRSPKGLVHQNSSDNFLKERENASRLRVKKIMKRATEDKDSSAIVQELRKEIREVVRNRSSEDFGEHLFDPNLLSAFRTAIAGPKTEPVKKISPLAVKVKKSLLEKGKVRENLTKKIYGNSNGRRRRRAWDRDCEVEFWKYRCLRATKPEKIETLKSVLNLLRKNPENSGVEPVTECQSKNSILSRLYLADTSVFPRKDDVKPLSALKVASHTDQSKDQTTSIEKDSMLSIDKRASKVTETSKVSSKVGIPSLVEKGTKNSSSSSKSDAASSKTYLNGRPKGSSVSLLGDSTVNSKNGMTVKSDNVKMDKRKWAMEILARKTAVAGKSGTHEKQEDNSVLKGNYPLLAQLPIDMRPALAPSCHNKIPISVRQTQLYRLTELFLRKANLPVIRRTAETELAIADAVNIEREVADRSNSKLVYLNLCSQEILHRSDNKKAVRATESNSSQCLVPVHESEQTTDKPSADPVVEEALRNAGLLSDSPPNSPHHATQVQNEVNISSMETKEEGPDSIFEMDSHPEVDIYGDFDYDLEDEDYIGASTVKVSKVQQEEVAAKMKLVFSTLNSENSSNSVDLKDGVSRRNDVDEDSCPTDGGIENSTAKCVTGKSCVPSESLPCEEGEDLSLAECEELYGPDKEPIVSKFPEESQKLYGLLNGEAPAENKCTGETSDVVTKICEEKTTFSSNSHNSSGIEKSPAHFQTGDRITKKETTSNTGDDKQCGSFNVHQKVEAYIKEHIRPLCKSGVITVEQYRWAVAKTTDKVMKYHSNAKNANFLIKEGEKVKKLAEQYAEAAAQQKGKINHPS
ncbi:hypothetical protein Patl1_17505 [Pistacia atlantica]|uniref:Uncharacterized protein n=1 Tax=Pistacia atlantica TaxID=434234 RepID=A0ACC1C265_9ROSI|nr:hypothetical protein Patl1_17505 [Pistacia atlantica]